MQSKSTLNICLGDIVASLRAAIANPHVSENARNAILQLPHQNPDDFLTVSIDVATEVFVYAEARSDELRQLRLEMAERNELPTNNVDALEEALWYKIQSLVRGGLRTMTEQFGFIEVALSGELLIRIEAAKGMVSAIEDDLRRLEATGTGDPDLCSFCKKGHALIPGGICSSCHQDVLDTQAPEGYAMVEVVPNEDTALYRAIAKKTKLGIKFTNMPVDIVRGSAKAALNSVKLLIPEEQLESLKSFVAILRRMTEERGQLWPCASEQTLAAAYIEWPGIKLASAEETG